VASSPADSPPPTAPGAPRAPRAPRPRRRSTLAARVLVVLTAIVMVFALAAGYTRRAVVDSDQFANRATAALRDDSVRTVIAERVTDQVVLRRQADLLAARPLIESAVSGIVGGGAFTGLFRTGVRDVHRAVFDRDEDTVTLTIADVGTVLSAALEKLQPSIARQVRPADRIEVIERHGRTLGASVADAARAVRVLAIVLPLLCLALAAGALWASPDRRRTVAELGVGAAAAGIAVVVLLGLARSVAVREIHGADARAAAGAIWDAFLGDLRTAGWVLAASGAIVTAAATSVLRPMDLGERLRRLAEHVATEQPTTPRRALRAVALIAAGVVALLARDAVVSLVVTAVAVLLIYAGVNALLRLVYRPPVAAADGAPPTETEPGAHGRGRRRLFVPVVAGGLVIVIVAAFLGTGGATTAAPRTGACDGHPELCDRPLDRVALVATHNAMSVPLPGWFSAEQDHPIARQLDDGVRGLLIDTHYADRLGNGRLRTYFGSPEDERRQAAQDGIGPDAVDAALRIRERLGFRGQGTRGMYLCHTFCELGATSLGSVLRDINTFLVTHPDEVMVVVNQDYVTPRDFVGAVNEAGLGDLVYRGPTTAGHWPTLRQMIDRNQRIVFLAENHAGGAPWYHPAYTTITEETPYTFGRVPLLNDPSKLAASCRANRGPERAPLFLINHWISTDPVPRPSDAQAVNAYAPLLRRVRRCEQIRHHVANLIAVNFYRRGEVFRVVDTLNGVGAG
jgi:hypothetical protein